MINAGAIMTSALVQPKLNVSDRFDHVLDKWQMLTGGRRPGFNNAVYLSEKQTADRNFALGYFMRENNAFPEGTDLHEILEFYFQCCSIELTCSDHANVAGTLANAGICPITRELYSRPKQPRTVYRSCTLVACTTFRVSLRLVLVYLQKVACPDPSYWLCQVFVALPFGRPI